MRDQTATGIDRKEEVSSAGRRLRLAFIAGALTDALSLIPMLHPDAARLVWNLQAGNAAQRFTAHAAACLMAGWTLLLWWASRQPLERRDVALLTLAVIAGLILAEIAAVLAHTVPAAKMIPTWILQAVLFAIIARAYLGSRDAMRRRR